MYNLHRRHPLSILLDRHRRRRFLLRRVDMHLHRTLHRRRRRIQRLILHRHQVFTIRRRRHRRRSKLFTEITLDRRDTVQPIILSTISLRRPKGDSSLEATKQ